LFFASKIRKQKIIAIEVENATRNGKTKIEMN